LWRVALLVIMCAVAQEVRGQPAREYQLKAVFLLRFGQFVDWPVAAFPKPDSPFVIGVLGPDPFGSSLDEAVRGEKIRGRDIEIHHFRRVEEVDACHILFINSREEPLESILARLKGRSILTVGDSENFARRGGIIRFLTEQGKVRLRINLEAAKANNLVVSSKLLRWAELAGKDLPKENEANRRFYTTSDSADNHADQQHGALARVGSLHNL